jgi:hypothetical protein
VILGMASVRGYDWRGVRGWIGAAAAAQFLLYGSYSVWWGGHTYGPRYMLDLLPLLVPAAAVGLGRLTWRPARALAGVAVLASAVVAATGALSYPHDRWNTDPISVDRAHARVWDWSDTQITRCWRAGLSPQNFNLFTGAAFRAVE